MRWFQYSIEDFEESSNPPNGSFIVMERKITPQESISVPETNGVQEPTKYWFEIDDAGLDVVKFRKHWRFQRVFDIFRDVPPVV